MNRAYKTLQRASTMSKGVLTRVVSLLALLLDLLSSFIYYWFFLLAQLSPISQFEIASLFSLTGISKSLYFPCRSVRWLQIYTVLGSTMYIYSY